MLNKLSAKFFYGLLIALSSFLFVSIYYTSNVTKHHKTEKTLSIIKPDGVSKNIIGKMMMSIKGSGKVKPGQTVNIKFYNYPYMEFGMVQGIVQNISIVPTDNQYAVEVSFPEGLKTNYNIDLDFIQKMKGRAEIITEDISLMVRIVRPLRSLIQNRTIRDYNPPQ